MLKHKILESLSFEFFSSEVIFKAVSGMIVLVVCDR